MDQAVSVDTFYVPERKALLALLRTSLACAILFACALPAYAAPTGLNTIPTTDVVPYHSWIAQVQNSNTQFDTPSFYNMPSIIFQSQFALTSKIEAGADTVALPDRNAHELVLNIKDVLQYEDDYRPNAAFGISNLANHLTPVYYLTLSKTLNYVEEQRERYRAHHRRNRKLLGRRIHLGLQVDGRGSMEPFVGADLQMSESMVFQTDWIDGPGNALTFGVAYVLSDQRTVLNPAFLFSNDTHRVNGFFLNISHQFNL